MKRSDFAALLVGVGLILVGVALGIIWMDYRQRDAAWMKLEAMGHQPDAEAIDRVLAERHSESRLKDALIAGSLGAGMAGAGVMLIVGRMKAFNPGP